MENARKVVAILKVNDDEAIKHDLGTLEYLDEVLAGKRPLLANGEQNVETARYFILDDEDEEIAVKEWYQAYLNYLITWVFENKEPAASPMSYQQYVDSKLPF